MKLILHNTSRYDTATVRKLARFAFDGVRAKARRQGWDDNFNRLQFVVHVGDTKHAWNGSYKGAVCAWWLRGYKLKGNSALKQLDGETKVRWIMARIGKPAKFPVDATYRRFKDMPAITWHDWQEAAVGLIAHELAHCQPVSGKIAEKFCEYTAIEVLEKFRAEREQLFSKPDGDTGEETTTTSQESETDMKKAKSKTKKQAKRLTMKQQIKASRAKRKVTPVKVTTIESTEQVQRTMPFIPPELTYEQKVNAAVDMAYKCHAENRVPTTAELDSLTFVKTGDFDNELVKRARMTAQDMARQIVAFYPRRDEKKQPGFMKSLAKKLKVTLPEPQPAA